MSQKERVKIKIKNFLKHFETSSTTKDEANVDDDSASLNNAGANEDKLKKKRRNRSTNPISFGGNQSSKTRWSLLLLHCKSWLDGFVHRY